MNLVIVNQSHRFGPLQTPPGALLWQTCLRQTLFVRNQEIESLKALTKNRDHGQEVFEAEKAYAFLLEVLCGLKSDMLGETEVLGQFKSFLQAHAEHELVRQDPGLWNSLLRDSKIVRDRHLKNLGCHSYGSLSRKLLRGKTGPVLVIGAGHLAQEILPWLKDHSDVRVLARDINKAKMNFANLLCQVESLNSLQDRASAILVCAPIDNEFLQKILGHSQTAPLVLDFRGESQLKPISGYHSFIDLMNMVKDDKVKALAQVEKAHELIQAMASDYIGRMQLRPLGWEDLCS